MHVRLGPKRWLLRNILPSEGILERALHDDVWKPRGGLMSSILQTRVIATLLYCDHHRDTMGGGVRDRARQMIDNNVAHLPALLRELHEA